MKYKPMVMGCQARIGLSHRLETQIPSGGATYETMANAKRITPLVIRRMCCGDRLHTQTYEPLLNV